MRRSFLVKFEVFSLQLYYHPNSFASIVLVFFVILIQETSFLRNIFWWLPLFYVSCEIGKPFQKPPTNRTNEKK